MDMLGIKVTPDRLRNCDETGLSYVVKSSKVVTSARNQYVYRGSYADCEESLIPLCCICANGKWTPPTIICKSVRWNEFLTQDSFQNAIVKPDLREWINSGLYLEWFTFFINSISPARPLL
jgi:hypothetical protein